MTELQLTQIRNYLLEKKLPIDILLEVQDHFVSQINDLQREENLSFDDALTKTKNSWQNELKPYWNGDLDLQDRSKLLRNINRNNFWSLTKKSVCYTLPIIFFLFILSKIITFTYFKFIFVILVFPMILIPIVNYLLHRKNFNLFRKYNNYILVSVQEYTILFFGGAYFYFRFFAEGFIVAEQFQMFFVAPDSKNLIVGFIFVFILIFASFLAIFSQKIYLQKIQKVKPFLQYLKPSN
ncbi:hypothetical protein EIH07_11520 [Chryseobacterium taklimakanense]|uniref:hypothetical protein n=1 Tax=Chryseobacterium taklimakanense TaxID=536441 RepID=UPI000F5EE74E|nr:hypothetical protein [Chryseobacterium taklimakanense]AZI23619.1 hypothetical protein EIH07_11520 [Chryseobacterium taklimakanense]